MASHRVAATSKRRYDIVALLVDQKQPMRVDTLGRFLPFFTREIHFVFPSSSGKELFFL